MNLVLFLLGLTASCVIGEFIYDVIINNLKP